MGLLGAKVVYFTALDVLFNSLSLRLRFLTILQSFCMFLFSLKHNTLSSCLFYTIQSFNCVQNKELLSFFFYNRLFNTSTFFIVAIITRNNFSHFPFIAFANTSFFFFNFYLPLVLYLSIVLSLVPQFCTQFCTFVLCFATLSCRFA